MTWSWKVPCSTGPPRMEARALPLEQRLVLAFGVALCATALATPCAIWIARRLGFFDHPQGYKGHGRATPYLGGMAVGCGIALSAIVFGGAALGDSPIWLFGVGLWGVGPLGGRIRVGPLSPVF